MNKNLLDGEVKVGQIKKGTTLYMKKVNLGKENEYREVRVYDIFLERYINNWKTTIQVITDNQILYTYLASDLGMNLFTEVPKENK